jgi:predicted dehydrogenase
MTKKAKIAAIGTGWWSTYAHIPTLKNHPEVELVALADVRPDVLAKAADYYDVKKTYTDYRELLANESLDGVTIAVWHDAHYEVARVCLEHNLHLVLEKPMVLQAADARNLIEIARERNLEIVMSYPWNYLPAAQRAREVLRSGELGPIHYISNIFSSNPLALYRGDDQSDDPDMAAHYPVVGPGDVYSDPVRSGGGQGHLQVTHSAGMMFFLTDLQPVSVIALMDNLDVRVDVVDAMIVRMDNGCLANVGSTGATMGGEGKLDVQIYCEKGWVDLDIITADGTIYHADGRVEDLAEAGAEADRDQPGGEVPGAGASYPAHLPAVNLTDIILRQAENLSPGVHGWRTVELLDAAYRSAARNGEEVSVASLYAD